MRAGTICAAKHVIQTRFNDHAGPVIFGKLDQLASETVPVVNNRVDKILGCLSLNSDHMLQTGQGVVPGRKSVSHGFEALFRKRITLLFARIDHNCNEFRH